MRRIAVLTSGGDCSGMNPAIRAVVRTALAKGIDVVGIQRGYRGLIDRQYEMLHHQSVSNTLQRGGTFLQSARCKEMMSPAGQAIAVETLEGIGIEGLVVIGGDGSLRGAKALHERGIKTIGIPASIDNDIPFTDMSLGVDTALNNICYAVDCLKDTASSHDRTFVVETMGRGSGYLALTAAVACGAEFALIPEVEFDLDAICEILRRRFKDGRNNSLILVAEGAASAKEIADQIKDRIHFETRLMVLGHYQRGGSPTAFDRLLACRFGMTAVEALLAGESGKMIGLTKSEIQLTELDKVISEKTRPIDQMLVKLGEIMDR